eukprot:g4398.t1
MAIKLASSLLVALAGVALAQDDMPPPDLSGWWEQATLANDFKTLYTTKSQYTADDQAELPDSYLVNSILTTSKKEQLPMRVKIFHKETWTSKEVCQSEHVVDVHQDTAHPWNLDVPFEMVAKQVKGQLETELNERQSHCHPVVKLTNDELVYKGDMEYWMRRTTEHAKPIQSLMVVARHLLETFYKLHDPKEIDAIGDQLMEHKKDLKPLFDGLEKKWGHTVLRPEYDHSGNLKHGAASVEAVDL